MTKKQATALSQLAYLDWPPSAVTLADFVREHRKKLGLNSDLTIIFHFPSKTFLV